MGSYFGKGTCALKRRAGSGRWYNICTQVMDSIQISQPWVDNKAVIMTNIIVKFK